MHIRGCCPSVGSPNHLPDTSTPQTHILTQPIALLSIPPNPSLVVAVPCSGALEARERESAHLGRVEEEEDCGQSILPNIPQWATGNTAGWLASPEIQVQCEQQELAIDQPWKKSLNNHALDQFYRY